MTAEVMAHAVQNGFNAKPWVEVRFVLPTGYVYVPEDESLPARGGPRERSKVDRLRVEAQRRSRSGMAPVLQGRTRRRCPRCGQPFTVKVGVAKTTCCPAPVVRLSPSAL